MTEQMNFRTSFNGFNREDVVAYLEELNAKHATEVAQFNSDLQYLQDKLTQYETLAQEGGEEGIPTVMQQADRIAELERQLAEAQEAVQTAEALLEEAGTQNADLQAQLEAALAHNTEVQIQQDAELNAYRRAERVERQATERARQIHDQANGALTDATAKVDEAAAQIAAMTEEALQQLKQLQLAITGSKQVLEDTSAALAAVCPAEEE